jgi:hypothetical protein
VAREKQGFGRELAVTDALGIGEGVQKACVGQAGEKNEGIGAGGSHQHHLTRTAQLREQVFKLVLDLVPFGWGDNPAGPDH